MPSAFGLVDRIANRVARSLPRQHIMIAPERPIVSFSFDDIPASAAFNGAAILERHGARGTFYVAGGLTGREHDGQQMLDDAGYAALAATRHELAHHTFSHRPPMALGLGYSNDLKRNDLYLDGIGPQLRRNFAYPYGLTSPNGQREVDRRYRSARGVMPGINRGPTDLGYLRSVEIKPCFETAELASWIDGAVTPPGWVIYFTHDVQDEPTQYGCRPAVLDHLVGHAIASGCEILTVDAALDRLGVAA
jgi:peptidoglycan/xylan/chitin deacetylase (PgdA/CDA1 family)